MKNIKYNTYIMAIYICILVKNIKYNTYIYTCENY